MSVIEVVHGEEVVLRAGQEVVWILPLPHETYRGEGKTDRNKHVPVMVRKPIHVMVFTSFQNDSFL